MIRFFKNWRESRQMRRHDEGYRWAAGVLLMSVRHGEAGSVEFLVENCTDHTPKDAFDQGALKALQDWRDMRIRRR